MGLHNKRKSAGLEPINQDVNNIVAIMKKRGAEALAQTAIMVTQAAQVAQQPQLQAREPIKLPSPCGKKTGIMFNGQVAWVDNSEVGVFEFMQDEYLGYFIVLIQITTT